MMVAWGGRGGKERAWVKSERASERGALFILGRSPAPPRPRAAPSHPHPATHAAAAATTACTVGWGGRTSVCGRRVRGLSLCSSDRVFFFSLTCQWNRSSPAGPAEHDVGGSFCRSCSSCGGRKRGVSAVVRGPRRARWAPAERAKGCAAVCAPGPRPRRPTDQGGTVRAWMGGWRPGGGHKRALCCAARGEGQQKTRGGHGSSLLARERPPPAGAGGRGEGGRGLGTHLGDTFGRHRAGRRGGGGRGRQRRKKSDAGARLRSLVAAHQWCVFWRPPLSHVLAARMRVSCTHINQEKKRKTLPLPLSRQLAQVALARGACRGPRHPRLHHPRQRPHAPHHRGRARGKRCK